MGTREKEHRRKKRKKSKKAPPVHKLVRASYDSIRAIDDERKESRSELVQDDPFHIQTKEIRPWKYTKVLP